MDRRDALRTLASGWAAALAAPWQHAFATEATPVSPAESPITRPIPSSQEALPAIGMGTWQTFDVAAAETAPLEEVLRLFAELGGRLIDSSPMYGRSEAVAGDLQAKLNLRPKLFVATKVWTSGKAEGIRQMEASLRKLKADPIDLMQVHNLLDLETHLATLAEWKSRGRIRYLGITHYSASSHGAVEKAMKAHKPDFVQINYSVGEPEAADRLLPLALDLGIAVIANRPFAGGDLLRRLKGRALPPWAPEIDCGSWAQLLLKFVISHPAVTCAIPATSKATHLRDNMGAGRGRLPDTALRAKIAAAATWK